MSRYIVGFDIGGTKCAVTLALESERSDEKPEIIAKIGFSTVKGDPYGTLERLLETLDSILLERGLSYGDASGIGISCGGPLDAKRGVIMSPPNLPGWDNVPVYQFFEKRTGIKCYLQNDANACAVAEWKYGAGRGCDSMAFLTFGTGLGAGLILDGRLYAGCRDMAGEIGHVRLAPDGPVGYGKRGSCEGFCSGGGIRQMGIEALKRSVENGQKNALYTACGGEPERIDAKMISELAKAGDLFCAEIFRRSAAMLGRTVAILCDVLDIELTVIGGIYMRSAELIEPELTRVLQEEALCPCRVVAAGLGERVGDYAALALVP